MSDTIEDLVRIYVGAVPRDVFDTALGTDIAYTLSSMFNIAQQEILRLKNGANLSTATGLFLDLHARDRGLRRQNGETDDQLRERLKRPPLAGTVPAILTSLAPIVGVKATLDLNPLTTNCETVIQAKQRGEDGNLVSIRFVADGIGTGTLSKDDPIDIKALTFHYQSGVTTVANFETSVASSDLIEVKTTDPSGTLSSPGDTFPKTYLGGGYNQAIIIELPKQSAYYDMGFCFDRGVRMGGYRGLVVVLIPLAANARTAVSDMVRSKVSAGKVWLVEEF